VLNGQAENILHLVALHRLYELRDTLRFAFVSVTSGFNLDPFAGHFLGDHADHPAVFW
jgi:hypothetical protein